MTRPTPALARTAVAALALLLLLTTPAARAQTVNLFDGTTLNGWTKLGGNGTYRVDAGTIIGTTNDTSNNTFLVTNQHYADFVLELDFKVDPDINSGVQIRSNSLAAYQNGRVHGYQVEIDPSTRAWTGGLYDEARRGWLDDLADNPTARAAFVQNQWNHFKIEAVGRRIRTWINDVPAADFTDNAAQFTPSGFVALQVHADPTSGQEVSWKNLQLTPVPEPTSAATLALAAGAALLRRRRRR